MKTVSRDRLRQLQEREEQRFVAEHPKLAELYARAALRAVKRYGPVKLIGCHGQTVYRVGGKHTPNYRRS